MKARWKLWSLVGLLAIGVAFLFEVRGRSQRLPNPNGFDDFIKAGRSLLGTDSEISGIDRDTHQALVTTNSEVLRLLHLGLTRRCAIPHSSALTNFIGSMNPMKRLVMLMLWEGESQEAAGHLGNAARTYADMIRFGNEMSRVVSS